MPLSELPDDHPSLDRILRTQRAVWPEHAGFLATSIAERGPRVLRASERMAALALRLAGGLLPELEALCRDYRYLCSELILGEELHFRRHGRYRLSRFAEAERLYYADEAFMARYMNGLLLAAILWSNHAHALDDFLHGFLPALPVGADLLEVGPGHGLLLALALQQPGLATATGWDVSAASIRATGAALAVLDPGHQPRLVVQDLFAAAGGGARFDAIVLSEVLEHLEDPRAALRALLPLLRPGGRVWVNIPTNSPAPDHLYLLRQPEEAAALLTDSGYAVLASREFPMTGYRLERARRQQLTISCVLTARAA